MNVDLLTKIENRYKENKAAIKLYKTTVTAQKFAEQYADSFNRYNGTEIPVEYIILYVPAAEAYTVVFNMSKWMHHPKATGTYLAWFAQQGFWSI